MSAVNAISQTKLIDDEIIKTNDGTKTYLIAKKLVIQPPNPTAGVVFTANSTSSYVFRMAEANPNYPPSTDQNFVRSETMLITGVTSENQIPPLSISQKNTSYSYMDGLGRKLQDVILKGSPSLSDAITPFAFDATGRMPLEYLPYSASQSNGAFQSSSVANQQSFYTNPPIGIASDTRPFNENVFESSPLNRVTDAFGAGVAWKDGTVTKSIKSFSKINTQAEGIIKWKHFVAGIPEKDGIYSDNQLIVQETIDEDGKISKVYKNLRDQTVLSREGDGTNWFDTYYLYMPSGLLSLVIQPEGVSRLSAEFDQVSSDKQSFINRWCFLYQYDDEQRIVAKRTPGWAPNEWAYTVYDQWNRVVLNQTPAQKTRNEWIFNKYDRFNRSVVTGLFSSASDRATLQLNVNTHYVNNPNNRFELEANNTTGYTLDKNYPVNPSESSLLSISYFDNYDFLDYSGWDAEGPNTNYRFVNVPGFPQTNPDPALSEIMNSVKGYVTGAKVRVLNSAQWLNSVTYYDKKYRTIQNILENTLGGRDRTTSKVGFTGRVLKIENLHASSITSVTTLREFDYDHIGRPTTIYQTTNGGSRTLLASNRYNEIGQLIEKNVHSTDNGATFLQSVDMRYNIRGWLTSINNSSLTNDGAANNDSNDLFGLELLYNPSTAPSITGYPGGTLPKLYSGDITAVKWKTDTKQAGQTPQEQIYGFEYDGIDRFKKVYYASSNAGAWSANVGLYNESIKSYDKNGNIQGIDRQGKVEGISTPVDSTTYGYTYTGALPSFGGISNRLLSIADAGNTYGFKDGAAQLSEEYQYDASGNLIFDSNKGISSISYNYLNLPVVIAFTRPGGVVDRIIYTYNATGSKLRTEVYKNGTSSANGTLVWKTDYVAEIQYDNNQLSFMATPEGRVVNNGGNYEYEYFYKDHQSNTRMVYGLLKETVSYRATMENPATSNLGAEENATFKNIASTRYNDPQFNYTKPSDKVLIPSNSSQTNSFYNKQIGPAKSLRIAAGDKVKMEVFAKYNQVTGSTATTTTAALISALATTTFGFSPGEAGFTSFNNNAPNIPGIGSASATLPKAYLAYLFLNDSYGYVTSSAVSISTSAFNAFEKLERVFTASQSGYLYVYVANEASTTSSNVYFDEMAIVHQKNNNTLQVTQASDYYPFGLSFNNYQAERIKNDLTTAQKNRYGFQGQEWQADLDLGWSQFKWRMHDPAIGRFGGVDPLSDNYLYNSTYAFSENRTVAHVELEGLEKWSINYSDGTASNAYGPYLNQTAAETYADNQLLISPILNPEITSIVDPNRMHPTLHYRRPHNGIDIVNSTGETRGNEVLAPLNGKIIFKGYQNPGAGNYIKVQANKDRKVHNFFHLEDGSTDHLEINQNVQRGEQIGNVGDTGGISSGPHLHYEVRENGIVLQPQQENPAIGDGRSNKTVAPKFDFSSFFNVLRHLNSNPSNGNN
ncbi:MAG: DUF6443 domain-containing protein [Cyclobacteriaceae bacterium]